MRKNEFYLYKYFSLDGVIETGKGEMSRVEVFENIVLNREIWVSSLEQLNDPFEKLISEDYEKEIDKIKQGIISLTTDPENMLMWSHYGNSHKGVLLKFKVEKNKLRNFKKVRYIQNVAELDLHPRIEVKSSCWVYENEYRYIHSVAREYVALEDIGLTLIGCVAGKRCSAENKEIIKELCLSQNLNLGEVRLENLQCLVRYTNALSTAKHNYTREILIGDEPEIVEMPFALAEEAALKEIEEFKSIDKGFKGSRHGKSYKATVQKANENIRKRKAKRPENV